MKRRQFISLVGAVAAWPWSAAAEAERRLGLLMPFSDGDPLAAGLLKAIRQSLAALGWHDGGNLKIEVRWGQSDDARSRAGATVLVETQPDAILADGPALPPVRHATHATTLALLVC